MIPYQLMPSSSDTRHQVVVLASKADQPGKITLRCATWNRNVMHPGFQGWIKEFYPFVTDVEYERFAQEEMLEAEASGNASVIEQVLVSTVVFKANFFSRRCTEGILYETQIETFTVQFT